ncbi:MAG TPA: VOC family protein [Lacipirellulaceae bacterium]|nr:VOC family protein [Lacipirellulaceae bacterium]
MTVQPYLYFNGRAEEAFKFYAEAIGATVTCAMRFKEAPGSESSQQMPPGMEDKIMHANLQIGDSQIMVSDGNSPAPANFDGFSLTLNAADKDEAARTFAALSTGGQVIMPLGETFFSPAFGMIADPFGVKWIIIVATM